MPARVGMVDSDHGTRVYACQVFGAYVTATASHSGISPGRLDLKDGRDLSLLPG